MINSAAAGGCLPPIALFDARLPELRRAFLPHSLVPRPVDTDATLEHFPAMLTIMRLSCAGLTRASIPLANELRQ